MSKKLETKQIESQLKKSAFFRKQSGDEAEKQTSDAASRPTEDAPESEGAKQDQETQLVPRKEQAEDQTPNTKGRDDREVADERAHHGAIAPSHVRTIAPEVIDKIRQSVRQTAKEASNYRLTPDEKKDLQAIEFTYLQQEGVRTSKNELLRIGANWLIIDYKENGEQSILHEVLKALNE